MGERDERVNHSKPGLDLAPHLSRTHRTEWVHGCAYRVQYIEQVVQHTVVDRERERRTITEEEEVDEVEGGEGPPTPFSLSFGR